MVAKMWKNWFIHLLAGGNKKLYSHSGGEFGSFLNKTKHWTIYLAITFLSFIPEKGNLCSFKNLYIIAFSSFICNSQKLEIAQMSFNRWMTQPNVVRSYYEILLRYKKEQTIGKCKNLGGFPWNKAEWKKIHLYNILEVNRLVISRVKDGVVWWVEGRWVWL